jgi:hypothetical protein
MLSNWVRTFGIGLISYLHAGVSHADGCLSSSFATRWAEVVKQRLVNISSPTTPLTVVLRLGPSKIRSVAPTWVNTQTANYQKTCATDTVDKLQRDLSRALDGEGIILVAMDDPDFSAVIADLDKQGTVNFDATTYNQLKLLAVNFVIRVNAEIDFDLYNGYHLARIVRSNTEFLAVASRQLRYLQNEVTDGPMRLSQVDMFPYEMQATLKSTRPSGGNMTWKLTLFLTNRDEGPLCFDPKYTLFYYQSTSEYKKRRDQRESYPVKGRRLIENGFCLDPKSNRTLSFEFPMSRTSFNGFRICAIPLTLGVVNASSTFQDVYITPSSGGIFQNVSDTIRRESCWDGV